MSNQEEQVKVLIRAQLEYCDVETTPKLCELHHYPENRDKIERAVLAYVREEGLTIAEAIIQLERDYNPNLMND